MIIRGPKETMQEIPGYKSIALDIAQRIVSGEFLVGSKISGRSLLSSQYKVSPETIRKAINLLKEEDIVAVSQGKEVSIISDKNAYNYISKNRYLKSVYSLKQDLQLLLQEKRDNDQKFEHLLTEIIEASDRLKNLKPYHPVEIEIQEHSHVVGKTIAELQFWQHTGATIIALRRGTHVSISPGPHVILLENDTLVVVGEEKVHEQTFKFVNGVQEEQNIISEE